MTPAARAQRVAEVTRIHAEGLAAELGAANPYYGQMVNAAVWRDGYRRMLDDKMANSRVRQTQQRRCVPFVPCRRTRSR